MVSVACLGLAFYMSWRLTLVLLATVPISVAILGLASRRLQPAVQAQKAYLAEASKLANASVSGIDLVKVYNGFDQEVWQYLGAIKASMREYLVQANCNTIQMGYTGFWIIAMTAIGFWYGVSLVDQGAAAFEILTAFYATLHALRGMESLMPQWLVLVKGMSAGETLRRSITTEGPRPAKPPGLMPSTCVGDITVKDVSLPSQ